MCSKSVEFLELARVEAERNTTGDDGSCRSSANQIEPVSQQGFWTGLIAEYCFHPLQKRH
jgi:hypothetical protein